MRIRKTAGALIIVALAGSHETVSPAYAGDEIADSVAGVIMGDGPEVSGEAPATPKRPKNNNRRAAPAPVKTPIWELDGPPIDRAGVDGR